MKIRHATINDLPDLVELITEFNQSLGFKSLGSLALFESLQYYINNPTRVTLLCETESHVVGCLIGFYEPKLFSPGFHAQDVFVFVSKNYIPETGLLVFPGQLLLKAFVQWAEEQGCETVRLALTNPASQKALSLAMKRYNFEQIGNLYAKQVTPNQL